MHNGTEMINDMKVTHNVPIINGRKPKFPFCGDHIFSVKMENKFTLSSKGEAFSAKPITISTTTDKDIIKSDRDRFLAIESFSNLSFIICLIYLIRVCVVDL